MNSALPDQSLAATALIRSSTRLTASTVQHSTTEIGVSVGVNATTGQGLWKIMGVYTPTAIADGVLTATDSVNGYTYGFGQG